MLCVNVNPYEPKTTNIPPQNIVPWTKSTQYMVTGGWKVFVVVKKLQCTRE